MPRLTPRQGMLALMVGAMLASPVVPASAATTLASFAAPTPVSAFRDTVVVSEFDTGIRAYRLGVLKSGGPVSTLPVAPRKFHTFDVSVGRGPDGRALVAFGDCPAAGPCGVYGPDPRLRGTRGASSAVGGASSPPRADRGDGADRRTLALDVLGRRRDAEEIVVQTLEKAGARSSTT